MGFEVISSRSMVQQPEAFKVTPREVGSAKHVDITMNGACSPHFLN